MTEKGTWILILAGSYIALRAFVYYLFESRRTKITIHDEAFIRNMTLKQKEIEDAKRRYEEAKHHAQQSGPNDSGPSAS